MCVLPMASDKNKAFWRTFLSSCSIKRDVSWSFCLLVPSVLNFTSEDESWSTEHLSSRFHTKGCRLDLKSAPQAPPRRDSKTPPVLPGSEASRCFWSNADAEQLCPCLHSRPAGSSAMFHSSVAAGTSTNKPSASCRARLRQGNGERVTLPPPSLPPPSLPWLG